MVRRSSSWSVPAGRVVAQPCSERKVAGTVTSSSDAASARTACGLGGQVLLAAGVDGQVQAEPEQLALAPGQPVGQVAGVVGGGLGVGVIELAPVGAGAAPGFQPGALAAQPGGGDRDRDRLDVQGDVQPARVGQQRLQPARADLGRVAGDRQRGGPVVPGAHVPGGDLDRRPGRACPGRPARPARRRGASGGASCGPARAGDRLAGQGQPPGRQGRRGGVGAGGEQGGDLPAVQHLDLQVGAGQQPGCLAGPLQGAPGGGRRRPGRSPWPGSRTMSSAWRVSTSRSAARSSRNPACSRAACSRAGCGRAGAASRSAATAADRSARPARTRICTGPVSEFSHRP